MNNYETTIKYCARVIIKYKFKKNGQLVSWSKVYKGMILFETVSLIALCIIHIVRLVAILNSSKLILIAEHTAQFPFLSACLGQWLKFTFSLSSWRCSTDRGWPALQLWYPSKGALGILMDRTQQWAELRQCQFFNL